MELPKIQIIETLIVIIGYAVTHYITRFFVNETLKQTQLQRERRKIIIKAFHLFFKAMIVFCYLILPIILLKPDPAY